MGKDILREAPPAVQKLFYSMWSDIQRLSRDRESKEAAANPVKHRLSKVFNGSTSYVYFSHKNRRGSTVRWCYSKERNVAGYFLIWREIVTKKQIKRDKWDATTSKACAVRSARELHDADAKRGSTATATVV